MSIWLSSLKMIASWSKTLPLGLGSFGCMSFSMMDLACESLNFWKSILFRFPEELKALYIFSSGKLLDWLRFLNRLSEGSFLTVVLYCRNASFMALELLMLSMNSIKLLSNDVSNQNLSSANKYLYQNSYLQISTDSHLLANKRNSLFIKALQKYKMMEAVSSQRPSRESYVRYLENLLKDNSIDFLSEQQFCEFQKTKSSHNTDPEKNQEESPVLLEENFTKDLTGKLAGRYCRQMLLKDIGFEGQEKIIKTKIAVIGSGGIGCPLAIYLAGAGVGVLGLFDSDNVDVSNLHRQIGHRDSSVGTPKTSSLKRTIQEFNPEVHINEHPFVTVETVSQLKQYDLIIDGSDNPECRYIVNDYCMEIGKKLLSGACIAWEGQITCYGGQGPCYRCIWGNEQTTSGGCSTQGVVGMLPGLVGIILATQALKLILHGQSSLEGQLLTYDSKRANFRKLKLRRKVADCIGCGEDKLDMNTYTYSKHAICRPDLTNLPKVPSVTWAKFLESHSKEKILDVRPSSQFNIAHLKQMVNFPYERLSKIQSEQELKQNLKEFNKDEKVFVSCTGGVMSRKGADILAKWGYESVNLQGGINQYARVVGSDIPKL